MIDLASLPRELIEEFEAAARRTLEERMRTAFIRTYKPVMDDAPYRSFETMEEYRAWCEEHLPSWLGYGRTLGARPQGFVQGLLAQPTAVR